MLQVSWWCPHQWHTPVSTRVLLGFLRVVLCLCPFVPIYKQAVCNWPYIKNPTINRIDTFQPFYELQHPNIPFSPRQPCSKNTPSPPHMNHHTTQIDNDNQSLVRGGGSKTFVRENNCVITQHHTKKRFIEQMARIQSIWWAHGVWNKVTTRLLTNKITKD